MLNSVWKESVSSKAMLPKDDPESFVQFVAWMYYDIIAIPEDAQLESPIPAFVNLFSFAKKYLLVALADKTMETLMRVLIKNNWLPRTADMQLAYKTTFENSKMRHFMSAIFGFVLLTFKDSEDHPAWNETKMIELSFNCKELWTDAFRLLRGQSGTKLVDPRKMPSCNYHQHATQEECPYAETVTITSPASSSTGSSKPITPKSSHKRKRT